MDDDNTESIDFVLEKLCPRCDGRKEFNYSECDECGGTGYCLTATGRKVLSLIQHNFDSMLQEASGR